MLAADPYYDDYVRTWRFQNGSWTTQDVARTMESGRAVLLSHDGHGRWFLFRQVDNNAGTQHVAPVDEFPIDKWNLIIALNGSYGWDLGKDQSSYSTTGPWNDVVGFEGGASVTYRF